MSKGNDQTRGPGLASTGARSQTELPDSQKGSAANAVGKGADRASGPRQRGPKGS